MRIFQLEAEGEMLLGCATTGDPSDKGSRDPLQDPGVALPHAQLRPNSVDERGYRDGALLQGIGRPLSFGAEGDIDLGDGVGPSARVLDDVEEVGEAVPQGSGQLMKVGDGPAVKPTGLGSGQHLARESADGTF